MKLPQVRIFTLSIPLKLTFTHAMAKRADCDSLIVELDDGVSRGYGEAVLREYVNGPDAAHGEIGEISCRVGEIVEILTVSGGGDSSLDTIKKSILKENWKPGDLPLLAAVEAAFLDLLCQRENVDIYSLLGVEPLRKELVYGGVVPILPLEAVKKMVNDYIAYGISYIRLKLSRNFEYNQSILNEVRRNAGPDYDIRVDVNAGWDLDDAVRHFDLLCENGVALIEEPLGPDRQLMKILASRSKDINIGYVADESAVSFEDIDALITDRSFSMINIRLAKNGGILRSLAIAEKADASGLDYQLGCHVGETGISSVTGRIAASLMKAPRYVDGSFDDYILADNVTTRSYSFGRGGKAAIIRGQGIGYEVDPLKLGRYAVSVPKTVPDM